MDNFIIIDRVEKLNRTLDKVLVNFPKKERVLKKEVESTLEEVYKQIYVFAYKRDKDGCMEVISLFKYFNYIIDVMYDKKIISGKKYLLTGEILIEISKMLRGYYNEKSW